MLYILFAHSIDSFRTNVNEVFVKSEAFIAYFLDAVE